MIENGSDPLLSFEPFSNLFQFEFIVLNIFVRLSNDDEHFCHIAVTSLQLPIILTLDMNYAVAGELTCEVYLI